MAALARRDSLRAERLAAEAAACDFRLWTALSRFSLLMIGLISDNSKVISGHDRTLAFTEKAFLRYYFDIIWLWDQGENADTTDAPDKKQRLREARLKQIAECTRERANRPQSGRPSERPPRQERPHTERPGTGGRAYKP
jgi:hypothetical protein